jgi:hypothetical protein
MPSAHGFRLYSRLPRFPALPAHGNGNPFFSLRIGFIELFSMHWHLETTQNRRRFDPLESGYGMMKRRPL